MTCVVYSMTWTHGFGAKKCTELIPVANDPEYEDIEKRLNDRLKDAIASLKREADYKAG